MAESRLPAIPYPPAKEHGYWDPITSTLDWCEENYYATTYSAEIVNSLTNLTFIWLAFVGINTCPGRESIGALPRLPRTSGS